MRCHGLGMFMASPLLSFLQDQLRQHHSGLYIASIERTFSSARTDLLTHLSCTLNTA